MIALPLVSFDFAPSEASYSPMIAFMSSAALKASLITPTGVPANPCRIGGSLSYSR